MPVAELRMRVMGGGAHVLVVGGRRWLAGHAGRYLEGLEARWSRFVPTSDVQRLNMAAGRPVVVAPETATLIWLAREAWSATGGRFDPTVHHALRSAGYDRSFEELPADAAAAGPTGPAPGAGCVTVDRGTATVTLPRGVGLDLGGIGKGYAADLAVEHLLELGAAGACVNLGGDVRAAGQAPDPTGWVVTVEHPLHPDRELARVAFADGAVATSSRLGRTWKRAGRRHHHLIDPRSGRPADTGLAQVTVITRVAWWAEALAKAAFIAGPAGGRDLLAGAGAAGLLVDDAGRRLATPDLAGLTV